MNLVSVIMNCHNGEKFLNESVKSVINQTYQNWELIFFDNLSNDNSKKILQSFRDKRIKYFNSKKFLDLYAARNLAIEKSSGKYISFLDTDDYWSSNKLEQQVKFLESNNEYKIVYSNYFVIDEKKKNKIIKTQNKATIWLYFTGIIRFLLYRNSVCPFRKKFFNSYSFNNSITL